MISEPDLSGGRTAMVHKQTLEGDKI